MGAQYEVGEHSVLFEWLSNKQVNVWGHGARPVGYSGNVLSHFGFAGEGLENKEPPLARCVLTTVSIHTVGNKRLFCRYLLSSRCWLRKSLNNRKTLRLSLLLRFPFVHIYRDKHAFSPCKHNSQGANVHLDWFQTTAMKKLYSSSLI